MDSIEMFDAKESNKNTFGKMCVKIDHVTITTNDNDERHV